MRSLPFLLIVGVVLVLMVGLVISDNASAGTHNIDGFVQPNLAGVTVTVLNSDTGASENTATEDDGYYSFSGLESGNYLVRFVKSGYLSELEEWGINSDGSMDDVAKDDEACLAESSRLGMCSQD